MTTRDWFDFFTKQLASMSSGLAAAGFTHHHIEKLLIRNREFERRHQEFLNGYDALIAAAIEEPHNYTFFGKWNDLRKQYADWAIARKSQLLGRTA